MPRDSLLSNLCLPHRILAKLTLFGILIFSLIGQMYEIQPHQCHSSTFDVRNSAGFKFEGMKLRHLVTPYSEWYTFYVWDAKQDVWFFINNIYAVVAGGLHTIRKSYPSYHFPNANGPRAELDNFDHFEAKRTHLDMHLWNDRDPSFSRMEQLVGDPHNGLAFHVSGLTSDRLTSWNLTFTKISSIGTQCISKKAKINMMHPEFSWLSLVPAAKVGGSITHDGITYNIDGFGSMEHVFGDMVQPALSWTYSFFHDGESFMMLAKGRKHMQRAVDVFVVETEGRRFTFGPNEYHVKYEFLPGYDYPHRISISASTDTERVWADITCIGDSFASDAKRGAAELRALFNVTICSRSDPDNCKIVTHNGAGWSEYYSFSMLDRQYLPILHQIPYRLLLGLGQQILRMEGWIIFLVLVLSHSTGRKLHVSPKKQKKCVKVL